jgi:hypothetical protein
MKDEEKKKKNFKGAELWCMRKGNEIIATCAV